MFSHFFGLRKVRYNQDDILRNDAFLNIGAAV